MNIMCLSYLVVLCHYLSFTMVFQRLAQTKVTGVGGVRRASAALIWIICPMRHRRLFLVAVFPRFSCASAPRRLPALMVGGPAFVLRDEEKLS